MAIRKWGTETLVNTTTAGNQREPVVTTLTDGAYVIAWEDETTSAARIRMQIYEADGTPRGAEITRFEVSATVSNESPSIMALDNGGFALSFDRVLSPTDTDLRYDRYDANGTIEASSVIDVSLADQRDSAISGFGTGLVAVYEDSNSGDGDIRMRAFDAAGALQFNVIVDSALPGVQTDPEVVQLTGGRIAVTWESSGTLYARVFESTGAPVAVEFVVGVVNTAIANPQITALDNGGFIITYRDSSASFPEVSGGIRAQVYDPDGNAYGSDIIVNSNFPGVQIYSDVTALPNGGFFIAWADLSGSSTIRGQFFDSLGNRIGTETIINTQNYSASTNNSVAVTALQDGRVVVAYETSSTGADGSDNAILSQIIDPNDGVVFGGDNGDLLYGNTNNDEINGLAGADNLFGLEGADTLFGGGGDDTLEGGAGADLLIGGTGAASQDVVSYLTSTAAVNVDINTSTYSGGHAEGDIMWGMDGITGSNFSDVLTGNNTFNALSGEGGNDTIIGLGGDDTIFGGNDNDLISGGNGEDDINAGGQADTVTGGNGDDTIIGGNGNDLISGDGQNDQLSGNDGNDTLNGGNGNDTLNGGSQADVLNGGNNNDVLSGDDGNDLLNGGGQADTLVGGNNNDTLFGGNGNDQLSGNGQTDELHGGNDNDTLDGGAGNDMLFGDGQNDVLSGGFNNDTLDGGTGNDTLTGGGQIDTFVFVAGNDADLITDFQDDIDMIDLSSYGFANAGQAFAGGIQLGGAFVFNFGGGDTLQVDGMTQAQLGDDLIL